MFATLRSRFLLLPVVLFALPCAASAGHNWVTIKNDTGKTIVVQETEVVNGQVKRGRATNLLAGETLREFIPGPTTKRVEVFDAKNPNRTLWTGNLTCKDANQTFSVTASGGKVSVDPVPPPKK